ncbi:uncharacterized protein [Misgurnus anguillicaudatus]|uniref:uncharacterized protein n=1 Tax=Misgurnus anguillicaudatus TaxID=75329 RepID=UPI003CCF487F
MFRPSTSSVKDKRRADVKNTDFCLPNAVPIFDYVPDKGLTSNIRRAAGGLNPCGGSEEKEEKELDVSLACAKAKCKAGGEEELVITEFSDDDYDDDGFGGKDEPKESKFLNFLKKTFGTAKCPFLQNNKVETLIPSKVNADSTNPNLKDDAGLARPESIIPDKRKGIFDYFRKGKVEAMPNPQLKADPTIPYAREVVDLAAQSKMNVGPKKNKQKAFNSRFLENFRKKTLKPVDGMQQLNADLANPVAMDEADPAIREFITHSRTVAASAELQTSAIPAHFWARNQDPRTFREKNAEKPRLKDSGEPGPKEAGKPGPKDVGKPGPKDTRKPGQKDDKKPRQKDGKPGLKVDVNPATFDDTPADAEPESGPKITSVRESLASKYDFSLSDVLGEGSFGRVYKGTRRSDGKEVAIKLMERNKEEKYLVIPGYTEPLPTEVGLTLKMRECHSPFVIEMYDWYEDPNMIALVLEYPQPCQTLWEFLTSRHTPLTESTARPLMYQAVQAVQHCLDHGVFHSDVHLGNFLLDQVNMKLTLIDFGLGSLLTDDGFDSKGFKGALQCTPPEADGKSKYYAMQTNVWALGVLLYCMVHKRYPYLRKATKKSHKLRLNKKHFSKELCDLIKRCLDMNPDKRPSIQEILDHDWFKMD